MLFLGEGEGGVEGYHGQVKPTKKRLEGAHNRVFQRWWVTESQKKWMIDATRVVEVRGKVGR